MTLSGGVRFSTGGGKSFSTGLFVNHCRTANLQWIELCVRDGGPAAIPFLGPGNGDDAVNLADAVYLVNYIFKGGPAIVYPCCPGR